MLSTDPIQCDEEVKECVLDLSVGKLPAVPESHFAGTYHNVPRKHSHGNIGILSCRVPGYGGGRVTGTIVYENAQTYYIMTCAHWCGHETNGVHESYLARAIAKDLDLWMSR